MTTTMGALASTRSGTRQSANATRRARKARGTMMVTSAMMTTAGRRAGRASVVTRASEETEDEFEAKLGALRGKRSKRAANKEATLPSPKRRRKSTVAWKSLKQNSTKTRRIFSRTL